VARRGATLVAGWARGAVADHGSFGFAVSGGTTPWAMFARLEVEDVPWSRTTIYQVDERIAPAADPDRNLIQLRSSLAGAPANVVPMPVEHDDPEAAAGARGGVVGTVRPLVHLARRRRPHRVLVPGDPVLDVADRLVAVTAEAVAGAACVTYPARSPGLIRSSGSLTRAGRGGVLRRLRPVTARSRRVESRRDWSPDRRRRPGRVRAHSQAGRICRL
jgi:hypothetical protein